jgi:GH15 family glucan-1,4-alpha-glucosidase
MTVRGTHPGPPDSLEGAEGVFVACSFWLAECLTHQGRTAQARAALARSLATVNDRELFAEEVDPATGTLLGNFPQALTHLSHITAAIALEQTS